MKRRMLSVALIVLAWAIPVLAAENGLQKGDIVAVAGDSITEQRMYSVFIEEYLLMCQPAGEIRTMQFGWGGETAGGFLGRMANDCLWLKPTVATTCYGMNDGGYKPMEQGTADRYRQATAAIVANFKKAGVRLIIVGSPGCVDADTFHRSPEAATMYNKTLCGLRDIAREVAQKEGVTFANVIDPMIDAMTKAKAKYGNGYPVAGGDGVHPGSNGHLIMAYAFLKAMGCDGDLGTITFDASAGKAEASGGHKVVSAQNGAIEIESSRYPFCFFGEPKDSNATTGIIEFFPFNQDLNRLKLVVTGATGNVKVTWGKAEKTFPAADLAKGINLAAEFIDNPFCDQWKKVDSAIRAKENFETKLHKQILHEMASSLKQDLPEEKEAIDRIVAAAEKKQKTLSDNVAALITPVKHSIRISQ